MTPPSPPAGSPRPSTAGVTWFRRAQIVSRRGLLAAGGLIVAACSRKGDEPTPDTTRTVSTPTPSSTPSSAAPTSATPTPTPSATTKDVLRPGIINVLILGTDSRTDNFSGNPDAIMVAQLSADRKQLALVSICRDTYVSYPSGGGGKINGAFSGGTKAMSQTVSRLLGGLPIHYIAQTGFEGFTGIVRHLDGIEVDNQHPNTVTVISTGRKVSFAKGRITLKGTDALIYSRERKRLPQGDLDRAERHRAVMTGMATKLQQKLQAKPTEFAKLLTNIVGRVRIQGGIDKRNVTGLIPAIKALKTAEIVSLQVPIARFGMVKGASVNIVNDARNRELAAGLKKGDLRAYLGKYGENYTPGG